MRRSPEGCSDIEAPVTDLICPVFEKQIRHLIESPVVCHQYRSQTQCVCCYQ